MVLPDDFRAQSRRRWAAQAAGWASRREELREWVAGRLARFKVPKAVEVTETLPRNASGKLLRRELR